ncbi:cytochrome c oxidase subunit III [Emticicia oligotrophica DSM 17448]|uniref:Cytochrome c oxidase subunit III n=1 Tax=Emticicia oligotrophica (strain DSM 17448 / CIP 109782 / MTCC 6937 / GPTSA100-15) TaxID=929562 RepID=A0ABN4AKK7_EMTOG|nr:MULTISPECIES: cytochrome c oxidase subunit 3 [Emticicia]AFK02872.1 cytochrome c oxidase subunit III [Emticicia oligotrophica DSM 17448]
MASAKTSTTAEHLIWKGGVQPMKVGYGKLMMWIFLLSDTFTFSALLVSYGLVRYSFPTFEGLRKNFEFSNTWWPIPERVFEAVPFLHGVQAPLVFVGIMTFILIMSSVTMVLAVEAGHRRDKADVEKYMLWTILGGIAFLSSQAWEWSHFIHGSEHGLTLKDGTQIFGANLVRNEYGPAAFADFFFFITGFHGTHVFSGVVLNVLAFYNTANGVYEKRGHYEMIEKIGLYWHFVDLVWVFVFTFFYLV